MRQSFPDIYSQAHIVVKSSPSSRGVVIEKDGSIYKLMFSWDFGVRRKDLEGEEEPSVIFLKATSCQNHHVFLKYAQDDLQGRLRSCGPNRYKALSASQWVSVIAKFSQQGCTGASLQPFPQRDKLWDQMVELWSQRNWVLSAWSCCSSATCNIFTCGTWDFVFISNKVTFVWWRWIIKSFVAIDLVRTIMGMALKDFSFWGLSFWSPGGLMFSVHLSA